MPGGTQLACATSGPFRSNIRSLVILERRTAIRGCMMRRDIGWMMAALLITIFLQAGASAQQTGIGGGKVSLPKTPGRVNTNPTNPSQTIYYMGKVVVDTGVEPPTSVAVLRVCNGVSHRAAFTSGDGSCAFTVGNVANGMVPDAS